MPRQQSSRILHPRRSLVRRLQQIPHLPRNIPNRSHRQQMPHRNPNPVAERPSHHQRPHHPPNRPFPGRLRGQFRRQQMFANRTPHQISHRIRRPRNPARKQQKPCPDGSQSVLWHRIRQRKRHQQQRARTNPCRRQRLHQRPLSPHRNHHHPQHK